MSESTMTCLSLSLVVFWPVLGCLHSLVYHPSTASTSRELRSNINPTICLKWYGMASKRKSRTVRPQIYGPYQAPIEKCKTAELCTKRSARLLRYVRIGLECLLSINVSLQGNYDVCMRSTVMKKLKKANSAQIEAFAEIAPFHRYVWPQSCW